MYNHWLLYELVPTNWYHRSFYKLVHIHWYGIMNNYDITNEICRLGETHEWSSTIRLHNCDKCIDISSVAMSKASVTPANATKQPDVYPTGKAESVYCFNPDIYDEIFWMKLKFTLTQVGCVSGCRLVLHYTDQRIIQHWKACYKLWCTHRSLFQNKGSSNYLSDGVGPCNVVTEHIKCVKAHVILKVMSFNWFVLLYMIFVVDDLFKVVLFCITQIQIYYFML